MLWTVPAWIRVLLPYVFALGGAAAAWAWFAGHYYDQGYAARSGEVDRAAAAYRDRIATINAANAATGAKADARLKLLREQRKSDQAELQEIIDREPSFAAVRRPDGLHARRVRDLDAIARAAADRELRD